MRRLNVASSITGSFSPESFPGASSASGMLPALIKTGECSKFLEEFSTASSYPQSSFRSSNIETSWAILNLEIWERREAQKYFSQLGGRRRRFSNC